MLLSAIIIVVLRLVNIVDNCHDNKWIFHYHSCKQAFKSWVGREREGSNYNDYTQTIIMEIMISRNTIIIMAESNILGNTIHTVQIIKYITIFVHLLFVS